eukprot:8102815-Lingulodinium_polyedra.AAC.1
MLLLRTVHENNKLPACNPQVTIDQEDIKISSSWGFHQNWDERAAVVANNSLKISIGEMCMEQHPDLFEHEAVMDEDIIVAGVAKAKSGNGDVALVGTSQRA